jgi:hypothetical protein
MRTLGKQRDADAIVTRLRRVGAETPGLWGSMSAHQMICHLNDSFAMAWGTLPSGGARVVPMPVLARWATLLSPLPWPKGLPTDRALDQASRAVDPDRFAADRSELERRVQEARERSRSEQWVAHPQLGALRAWQWQRLCWLHTNHHLRQFGA